MPAATNRKDLIAVTRLEWDKLGRLLDQVSDEMARHQCEGGVTIRDVIGHRAHWIGLFLGWYADGQAGRNPALPAPGYKWNQLTEYNARIREVQAGMTWPETRAMLAAEHARLVAFYEARDDAALYGGPMQGGGNKWTAGRWSEASGASHYRSAAKFARKCLRAAKGS